jgi:hypothetical protein
VGVELERVQHHCVGAEEGGEQLRQEGDRDGGQHLKLDIGKVCDCIGCAVLVGG